MSRSENERIKDVYNVAYYNDPNLFSLISFRHIRHKVLYRPPLKEQSVCLSVCMYVCLSICPSVRLSIYLSVCLSVRSSVYPSVYLSARLSICLPVYLSVCLSICLPICLSVSPHLKMIFGVLLTGHLSQDLHQCLGVFTIPR